MPVNEEVKQNTLQIPTKGKKNRITSQDSFKKKSARSKQRNSGRSSVYDKSAMLAKASEVENFQNRSIRSSDMLSIEESLGNFENRKRDLKNLKSNELCPHYCKALTPKPKIRNMSARRGKTNPLNYNKQELRDSDDCALSI